MKNSQKNKLVKTIAQKWQDFKIKSISPNAPSVQVQEMCLSFYMGAASFFSIINSFEELNLSEDESLEVLSSLDEELKKFVFDLGTKY